MILQAARPSSVEQEAALASMCVTYWYPLYAFLRHQGKSEHDAQDLTQGFFEHLLSKDDLGSVRPEKGRFRSFLLKALQNFVFSEHRRDSAQKRGGGMPLLSLDAQDWEHRYRSEPATDINPESLYHRNFANALVARAMERLAEEYRSAGKGALFDELVRSMTANRSDLSAAEHAAALGISRGAVSAALYRMRTRYGEILRAEVAATLDAGSGPAEIENELQALLRSMTA